MEKYFIKKSLICFLLLVLNSCNEDTLWDRPTDMCNYVPNECIVVTGNCDISNNSANFHYLISLCGNLDFWQLEVKSVDFYIDDDLIDSKAKSPYNFNYRAIYLDKGIHLFTVRVNFIDLYANNEFFVEKTENIEITSEESPIDDKENNILSSHTIKISGSSVDISIREVLLSNKLSLANWQIDSMEYYLDDELIGNSNDTPFAFTYSAVLQRGEHKFKLHANINNPVIHKTDQVNKYISFEVK